MHSNSFATGVNPFQVTWSAGSEGAMLKVDDNGNTHVGIGNLVTRSMPCIVQLCRSLKERVHAVVPKQVPR